MKKNAAKKKSFVYRSNREKVRQTYRKFLAHERTGGLKLKKSYTTADILSRISPSTDRAAAAKLREIYLLARYDEEGEITRSQADAAREALKRIKTNQ